MFKFAVAFFLKALRDFDGSELQVCYCIIHIVLRKPPHFENLVNEFVSSNTPQHWRRNDWHEKHMAFHQVALLSFCVGILAMFNHYLF